MERESLFASANFLWCPLVGPPGIARGSLLKLLVGMEPRKRLGSGFVDGDVDVGVLPRGRVINLPVDFLPFLRLVDAEVQAADQHGPKRVIGELRLQLAEEAKGFIKLPLAVAGEILSQIKLCLRPVQFALVGAKLELP